MRYQTSERIAMLYRLTEPLPDKKHPTDIVSLSQSTLKIVDWTFASDRPEASAHVQGTETTPNLAIGTNSLRAEIRCIINRSDEDPHYVFDTLPPVKTLLKWSIEDQTVPDFPQGRFGLWFPPDATLTHDPTRESGYQINDITVNGDPSPPTNNITIRLGYHGKPELHDVFKKS